MTTFRDSELTSILAELPVISTDFNGAMTDVNRTKCNAKVFYNPRLETLEIYPDIGGFLSAAIIDFEADIAPFSD